MRVSGFARTATKHFLFYHHFSVLGGINSYALCCWCCWCCHRTSNSRRLADHIKPRKLHIADKAAELVGHLAKVDKAVSIIYTPQYLALQARLTNSISAQLKSHSIVNSNIL